MELEAQQDKTKRLDSQYSGVEKQYQLMLQLEVSEKNSWSEQAKEGQTRLKELQNKYNQLLQNFNLNEEVQKTKIKQAHSMENLSELNKQQNPKIRKTIQADQLKKLALTLKYRLMRYRVELCDVPYVLQLSCS